MDNKVKSIIILFVTVVFLLVILVIQTTHVPKRFDTDFEIKTYMVPNLNQGHIRFVIECKNTGLQKEYFINQGSLFFGGYVNKNITDVATCNDYDNPWDKCPKVGGILCDLPKFVS